MDGKQLSHRRRPSAVSQRVSSACASLRATNMWRSTAPRALTVNEQLSEMQRLQQLRALRSVNELADRCFDLCVTDFGMTKTLRSSESECLDKCVAKYLIMSQRTGENFAAAYGKALPLSRED
jgi:hypothetical protein